MGVALGFWVSAVGAELELGPCVLVLGAALGFCESMLGVALGLCVSSLGEALGFCVSSLGAALGLCVSTLGAVLGAVLVIAEGLGLSGLISSAVGVTDANSDGDRVCDSDGASVNVGLMVDDESTEGENVSSDDVEGLAEGAWDLRFLDGLLLDLLDLEELVWPFPLLSPFFPLPPFPLLLVISSVVGYAVDVGTAESVGMRLG